MNHRARLLSVISRTDFSPVETANISRSYLGIMRLLAISDLHLGFEANRSALQSISGHHDDWLILCGDLGETVEHLEFAFKCLAPKFKRLIWTPGNHELWTDAASSSIRGELKYAQLVKLAGKYGVLTPEDPYPIFSPEGREFYVAPVFTLYDYSFGPDGFSPSEAIAWAAEEDISCADEIYLHFDPFPSRMEWCRHLCEKAEAKLAALDPKVPIVLVDHFPLRRDLVYLPAIPRFSIWCGTRLTENWHKRFNVSVAVSGHLHLRSTKWRDGVRFEEVSLGYPRQWSREVAIESFLCQVLPYDGPRDAGDRYFGALGRSVRR